MSRRAQQMGNNVHRKTRNQTVNKQFAALAAGWGDRVAAAVVDDEQDGAVRLNREETETIPLTTRRLRIQCLKLDDAGGIL